MLEGVRVACHGPRRAFRGWLLRLPRDHAPRVVPPTSSIYAFDPPFVKNTLLKGVHRSDHRTKRCNYVALYYPCTPFSFGFQGVCSLLRTKRIVKPVNSADLE